MFHVDAATGTLTPLPGNPVSFPMSLGCIRFFPNGKFAYALPGVDEASSQLSIFSVNPDGSLSQVNSASLPWSGSGLAIDPTGAYLYATVSDPVANGSAALYGYKIDSSDGSLTPIDGMPMTLPTDAWDGVAIDPSGSYLYLSNESDTDVSEYTIDAATGKLTPVPSATVNPCINPTALKFSPDGTHAYLTCGQSLTRDAVNVPLVDFSVGANGQLTEVSTPLSGPEPFDFLVDPSGKYVYVLGSGSDNEPASAGVIYAPDNMVLVYQVNPDGTLTLVNQVAGYLESPSFTLLSGAKPVTWAPAYAYLTTADNQITGYTVDADGTLSNPQSVTAAATPSTAALLPWGSNLLVASQGSSPVITPYTASAGTVAAGGAFASGVQIGGLALASTGNTAYLSDPAMQQVDVYSNAYLPGQWLQGNPFTAGAGAGPIATDPSGRYVVTGNQTDNTLTLVETVGAQPIPPIPLSYTPLALQFDPTGNLLLVTGSDGYLHLLSSNGLGALTQIATAALAGNMSSIAVDPTGQYVYVAGPGGLQAFVIDAKAATLTPISLNIPVSLANATGVYMEPSGQFVYVAVNGVATKALYAFTLNSDGTLTQAGSGPVATGQVTSMTFQDSIQ